MNTPVDPKEKAERIQRAKNKIQLMRKAVNQRKSVRNNLLALVREYVSQRPEVTVKIVKKWINKTSK